MQRAPCFPQRRSPLHLAEPFAERQDLDRHLKAPPIRCMRMHRIHLRPAVSRLVLQSFPFCLRSAGIDQLLDEVRRRRHRPRRLDQLDEAHHAPALAERRLCAVRRDWLGIARRQLLPALFAQVS
ncbi:hypothetical protein D5400_17045 [Georhizobium profundi]|uniref:Uncharacterized protein n=1 Tax=Georhizobium profundi TaxID=2341112 RepID=A0A3Q8XQD7_9HYPH|nr:hypothetical protein D5400_17045 [Georhizobium profundi]